MRTTRAALWRAQTARIEHREITRQKNEHLAAGKDLAARLRHAVRAILGPYDERLEQFGVAPVRKRRRER